MSQPLFKGIFAALTTPLIGEDISLTAFRQNLNWYNKTSLDGYVVLGSTGEAILLNDRDSLQLVEEAVKVTDKGKKIIVGTARESTRLTIEFTNQVAQFPVSAVLVRTPSYYKNLLTPTALKEHYLRLADAANKPIILYNIPQNTGISFDLETLFQLAEHPNIVGIKDSSGNLNFLVKAIPHLPSDFSFLLGAGGLMYSGLTLGASGGILALAAVAPEPCCRLFQLVQENKHTEAQRLQLQLAPLNSYLTQEYGIPGIKYALDQRGLYGGPTRSPLLSVPTEGQAKINQALKELGLLD
ncbi:MAG: dihydrodipicolinate synthase family protein [Candidatus Aminicenantes bacterium]|nr:dihydrodipicolinate synthase family protein [Candidatus Aminicenantes bacterium]